MGPNRKPARRTQVAIIVSAVLVVVAAALVGVQFFERRGQAAAPAGLEPVAEVIKNLQDRYVEKDRLKPEALTEAAIRGIIDYVNDPYTSYMTAEQYRQATQRLSGDGASGLEGIGAEVTLRDGRHVIVAPLPDSPAMRAGVRPGDVILAVDGNSIEGLSLREAVSLIRGKAGTPVTIQLLRTGSLVPLELTITRDAIRELAVLYRLLDEPEAGPGIGYLRLSSFTESAPRRVREATEDLRRQGATALVFDLRGNFGGLVDSAVGVTSEFVETGQVFTWKDGSGESREFVVSGGGTTYDLPMVVLVNEFSASAAEIVAGALQDHGRATVVGTTTFGKGSVNLLISLQGGAGLEVTSARWFTPKGRAIEGEGLTPDVLAVDVGSVDDTQQLATLAQGLCLGYQQALRQGAQFDAGLAGAVERLCSVRVPAPAPSARDDLLLAGIKALRTVIGAAR